MLTPLLFLVFLRLSKGVAEGQLTLAVGTSTLEQEVSPEMEGLTEASASAAGAGLLVGTTPLRYGTIYCVKKKSAAPVSFSMCCSSR